jgi:hypothetical protein
MYGEVEIDQELHTYKYWTALRFAKEDDISPSSPLKDIFLQNIRQFILTVASLIPVFLSY